MSHQYKVSTFRADKLQTLRNVRLHSPSIIQIIAGSKRLYQHGTVLTVSPSQLLLCGTYESLSFENWPNNGYFSSRMFSFYFLPDRAMLELSMRNGKGKRKTLVKLPKEIGDTLNALFSFDQNKLSKETQSYWLSGLYQQLAEYGLLHYLFTDVNVTFTQKLSRYLSHNPSEEHSLISLAHYFGISRSTMIRKLKQEHTTYRDVLLEVRLNHALQLIQIGQRNVAMLAQLCGYQSEERFSQRFKNRFDVSPSEYIKTLQPQG